MRLQVTKLDEKAMETQLPKEILWLIFQRAIPPKFLLDSFLCAGQDSPWARTLELKKNLTLVSRTWSDVGSIFLYEDVAIRQLPQIKCLLRTLESAPSKGLGKLIKSLELKCYIPGGPVAVQFGHTLQALLAQCINLSHFSYFSPCALPSAVFRMDDSLPTTITRLHLDIMVDFDTIQRVVAHLQGHLQYIRIGLPVAIPPQIAQLSFPSLHTLWLETTTYEWSPELLKIATWAFPSLQRLIISHTRLTTFTYSPHSYVSGSSFEEETMLSFLTKLGSKIKYLCLKHHPSWDRGFLQRLFACCPLLERVSFDMVYVTYNAVCRIGPHPTLKCVDFLLQNRDLRVYFTTVDTPSFLGFRQLFGLPPFAYQWLHQFDARIDTEMDDSFKVDLFHHRLNKDGRDFSWDVVASAPRLRGA